MLGQGRGVSVSESQGKGQVAPWELRNGAGRRGRLRRLLPWFGFLVLGLLVAWGLWPQPVVVEVGWVERGPLTVRVAEEGRTRIRNRYVVSAPVTGTMRRVALKPGDPVEAGVTVLTVIEPAAVPLVDPRARAQAEAAVAGREAARRQLEESRIAAESVLRLAEAERARVLALDQRGALSDSDRERVESEALVRAAELRAVGFSIQVADHELAQARAVLERPAGGAPGNRIELKSPVGGRVLKVFQESEAALAAGTPILEVGDPADLEIEAEILSRDAVAIREGDPVVIGQWGGDEPLKGRVRRVEPAAFTKVSALGVEEQRVLVLCDLLDPAAAAGRLGDRFRVELEVSVWHADDTLRAPAGALFRQGGDWKTFVHRDGRARLLTVRAGRGDGRMTEVLGGLEVGDQVLLHPPDVVRDGSRVRVRN